MVRGRNRTIQITRNISAYESPKKIVQRECVSVEASEDESSEDCFNFESEGYNMRRK